MMIGAQQPVERFRSHNPISPEAVPVFGLQYNVDAPIFVIVKPLKHIRMTGIHMHGGVRPQRFKNYPVTLAFEIEQRMTAGYFTAIRRLPAFLCLYVALFRIGGCPQHFHHPW